MYRHRTRRFHFMKTPLTLLPALLGALFLTGCIDDGYYGGGYSEDRPVYRGGAYYDSSPRGYYRQDVVIVDRRPSYYDEGEAYYYDDGRYYCVRGGRRYYAERSHRHDRDDDRPYISSRDRQRNEEAVARYKYAQKQNQYSARVQHSENEQKIKQYRLQQEWDSKQNKQQLEAQQKQQEWKNKQAIAQYRAEHQSSDDKKKKKKKKDD